LLSDEENVAWNPHQL